MVLLITKIAAFITFMGLPQALGYASAYHTRKFAGTYYPTLKKPFWAPPQFLLKPLWIIMYGLMGFASYLVWRQKVINNVDVKVQLALYSAQLFFNIFWAPIFFRIQSPLLGLICLLLNLITATLATTSYISVSPKAVQLMIPYLAFLFFSGYLNKAVWRLNQKKDKKDKKSKKVKKIVVSSSESDSE